MKKLAIVLVLGLALTGCGQEDLLEKNDAPVATEPAAEVAAVDEVVVESPADDVMEETLPTPAPPAPVEITTEIADFYFESGDDGLTLLKTSDSEFKQILTTDKILDAELIEGILTFTAEDENGLPNTEVMNLQEYLDYLNSLK